VLALQAPDVRIGLLGRFFANMARIEDHQIGILAVARGAHPARAEQLGHALAVVDVHLAAETFDFEGLGSHSAPSIGDCWGDVKPSVSPIASRAACANCLRPRERSRGANKFTVTGSVPRRPSSLKPFSIAGCSHQLTSVAARP